MVHSRGEWSCPESDCGTEVAGLDCSSPEKNLLTDRRATMPPIVKNTCIFIAQKKLHTVWT